jgi:hypothetical protein
MLVKRISMFAVVAALAACDNAADRKPVAEAAPVDQPAAVAPAPSTGQRTAALFEPVATDALGAEAVKAPCSIDKINGQQAKDGSVEVTGGELLVGGWVASPDMQAPQQFMLVIEGGQAYQAPGATGVARPDLVRVLKADGLANAGFNVRAKLQGVAPGEYALSITHHLGDQAVRCQTAARINVSGA